MRTFVFSAPPASAANRRPNRLQIESLECRTLMSADSALADIFATPGSAAVPLAASSGLTYLTPSQVRSAYGFNQISFGSVQGNGAGQTIAIVDAYDDVNIQKDLNTFDSQFGVAATTITKVEMAVNGRNPASNANWAVETSLDVEWAHAIAPAAKILLVEANDASLTNLLNAVNYAREQAGVSVVSMSWGSSEFSGEASYDSYFQTPAGHTPVAFVASSGDNGKGAIWPAVSTNVLAVGGTSLTVTSSGGYGGETAWSGSGGGYSTQISEPSWQKGSQSSGYRSTPDVSYDANPNSGFLVYDSVPYQGSSGWWIVGGTSAGAPQWSALIAIADQGLTAANKPHIGNAASTVYGLSSADFHDITSGSNGYSAAPGYDVVTGRGSPIANKVVADLVNAGAAPTTAKAAVSPTAVANSLRAFLSGDAESSFVGPELSFSPAAASVVAGPANVASPWAPLSTQLSPPTAARALPTTLPGASLAASSLASDAPLAGVSDTELAGALATGGGSQAGPAAATDDYMRQLAAALSSRENAENPATGEHDGLDSASIFRSSLATLDAVEALLANELGGAGVDAPASAADSEPAGLDLADTAGLAAAAVVGVIWQSRIVSDDQDRQPAAADRRSPVGRA